ncbi:helix-turn-helix transcriptional regulator [Vulcaniibacterium tengchongense]|uniref:Helix-turn-helix protein n=1 Tax=Vulcaniibacterium tengchongense TaxID=1273429 RepID=A0A3N4UX32_9GAMM|nr:helix-turn-helix transcriptional regulator [Vulcaniibacterium tengchongense]RPE74668.1 helix-turn-helix protein [Vulcaniibacterium tengchongense]
MTRNMNTPVARWRARMGLSQRAAAEALGMALSSYQDQERGINRQTGQPIRTPLTLLLACAAIERGIAPVE